MAPVSIALRLTEKFDLGALAYIVEHFKSFSYRPETNKSETLAMLRRYKATSAPDGTREVTYRQAKHGTGRYFAERGMSLQSMAREVRNAIAFMMYYDIDFVNCHPQLLKLFCEQHGVPCPALRAYCDDRDAVLVDLGGKDHGKPAVLAVINGGAANPEARGVRPSDWLAAFESEMRAVREAVATKAPEFLALAQRSKGANGHNVLGSAVNLLLCNMENTALMALREFMEQVARRPVGVLVFDGCMVERTAEAGPIVPEELQRASEYVRAKTGLALRLAVKDMAGDKLAVPSAVYCAMSGPLQSAPRFAIDDREAGAVFAHEIADFVRSCKGRIWARVDNIWVSRESNVDWVDNVLLARCLGANIRQVLPSGADATMSGNVPSAMRIIKAARAVMPSDPGFEASLWDSVRGCMCWNDGLYDFRQGRFFTYEERPDVHTPVCIPHAFPHERPPAAVTQEVVDRLLMGSLGDADKVRTLLELKARAAAGEVSDKQMAIMLGLRDCGKGLLQEMDTTAFRGYTNPVQANAFLMKQHAAQDAAKSLSWALDCEHTRFTYTNEVSYDEQAGARSTTRLDGNLLKGMQSGGDTMLARKNHKDEREFRFGSKLFMNMNEMPEIVPPDAVSTMLVFNFPYKFVPPEVMAIDPQPFYRIADPTIKEAFCSRPDVVAAYTWLVIDAYKPHPVRPCAAVTRDSAEFREDMGDKEAAVRNNFQVTLATTDFVTIATLKEKAVEMGIKRLTLKQQLLRMGAREDPDCCFDGVRHGRGLVGVRYADRHEPAD